MKNKYKIVGNDIWIEHTRTRTVGENLTVWSYISQEDFDVANSIDGSWTLDYDGVGQLPYIYHSASGLYLHRDILKKYYGEEHIKDMHCDHIDGNRLNNRHFNLQPLTSAENSAKRRKRYEKPISDPNGLQGWFYDITEREKDGLKHIAVNSNSILIARFKPGNEELANITWQVADMFIRYDKSLSEVIHSLTNHRNSKSIVYQAIEVVKKNLWWEPPF